MIPSWFFDRSVLQHLSSWAMATRSCRGVVGSKDLLCYAVRLLGCLSFFVMVAEVNPTGRVANGFCAPIGNVSMTSPATQGHRRKADTLVGGRMRKSELIWPDQTEATSNSITPWACQLSLHNSQQSQISCRSECSNKERKKYCTTNSTPSIKYLHPSSV